MLWNALSVKRRRVLFLALIPACLAPAACLEKSSTGPNDENPVDDPAGTISASVILSDLSQPFNTTAAPALAGPNSLSGELTFSGLRVELWDGEGWLLVTETPTTAAVTIADGTVSATPVQDVEIPAGDYTKARLTATEATVDVTATLDGRTLSAQIQAPADPSLVIEKEISVVENEDGSRTFRVELETIRTVSLQSGALLIEGDLGSMQAAAFTTAGLSLADVSAPDGVNVSGTVHFENLSIELWDGESWILVTDEPTTADVTIGGGAAEATFIPLSDIPAGTYTKTRLTATAAQVDVTAELDGRQISAQLAPAQGEPIVIEKDVQVVVNEDGTTTFIVEIATIQSVILETLSTSLVATGDMGTISGPAQMGASVVASDLSSPEGVDMSGNVTFTGLTIELSQDGESWVTVAEESGEAVVALGDGLAEATLIPFDDIQAGFYTHVRLTANDAMVDITVDVGGGPIEAQLYAPGGAPIVIEKQVEAVVNDDGTTTFRFELECVRTIEVTQDPVSGGHIVTIDGDIGVAQAQAG